MKENLARSLAMIAFMVSEKTGIRVFLRPGAGAATNGESIIMPQITVQSDKDWMMCQGYLYHEAAHVKYTAFDVVRETATRPVLNRIRNTLEDIRVENELAASLPGVQFLFSSLTEDFVIGEEIESWTNKEVETLNFILAFVRMKYTLHGNPESRAYQKYAFLRSRLADLQGDSFVSTLEDTCSKVEFCHSSSDVLRVAEEIHDFLKQQLVQPEQPSQEEQEKQQEQENGGEGESGSTSENDGGHDETAGASDPDEDNSAEGSGADGEGDSDDPDSGSPASGDETPSENNAEQDETPGAPEADDDNSADEQGADGAGDSDNSKPGSAVPGDETSSPGAQDASAADSGSSSEKENHNSLPGASSTGTGSADADSDVQPLSWDEFEQEADAMEDLGDKMREWLKEKSDENAGSSWIPKLPEVQRNYPRVMLSEADVLKAGHDLADLRRVIVADALKRERSTFTGQRLNSRKLAGVVAGTDLRAFRSKTPRKALDTYLHLLVDASGSMYDHGRMRQANMVMAGMNHALRTTPGIRIEVTGFTSHGAPSYEPVVFPYRKEERFSGFCACENTPLGEALSWTLMTTLQARERRKIIFVITDGVPDNTTYAREVLCKIRECGVQIVGIVISCSWNNLFSTCLHINEASELPAAIRSIWTQLLYPEA